MAKNTSDDKFRKVNVDEYNEDSFVDEAADEIGYKEISESELTSLLGSGKNVEALQLVLKNPPIGSKDQSIKDKALQQIVRVLMSFKASNIEEAVKTLNSDQVDYLMKYIFRAFESPSENNVLLLTWHEKTFNVGKLGCIVRVLTNRKRV